MSEKMFDCYFIATDSKNRTKVRFANDYEKRKQVLLRDRFTFNDYASDKFDRQLTKEEILDQIDENELNEVEFQAYQQARSVLNKNKTTAQDILDAIRERGKLSQRDQVAV